MKLSDFSKLTKEEIGIDINTYTNLDDRFALLRKYGFKEIEVDKGEMLMITRVYLSNSGDKDPNKHKILREGKVDRFYGVDIIELV